MPSKLDTALAHDLAVATESQCLDPRSLGKALFVSCFDVYHQTACCRERAVQWEQWSPSKREESLDEIDEVLRRAWPEGCSPEAIIANPHRHLGDLSGDLSIDACTIKEDDPGYTKPMHAFWTCPILPGTGPVGFEALVRELNPHQRYASWDVKFEPCKVIVVDSAQDWRGLVSITGAAIGRDHKSPRWDRLNAHAVHVTNRAIIESFADGETPLWDWGMEQTAWLAPRGTYLRLSETESWQDAVARLSA